jgi:hypothetical protein
MEENAPGLLIIISKTFHAILRTVEINIGKTAAGVEIQSRDLSKTKQGFRYGGLFPTKLNFKRLTMGRIRYESLERTLF